MTPEKINETIAIKIMKWHKYESAWFGEYGHYKCEAGDFLPAYRVQDAIEVLEDRFNYHVEIEYITWEKNKWYCNIKRDEGKIEESHFVDTCYEGEDNKLALAICKAILATIGVEA